MQKTMCQEGGGVMKQLHLHDTTWLSYAYKSKENQRYEKHTDHHVDHHCPMPEMAVVTDGEEGRTTGIKVALVAN